MRVQTFLFGVTLTSLACVAFVEACGGDTGSGSSSGGAADAGKDSTTAPDVVQDTTPVDTGSDAPTCNPNNDPLTKIPDADIGDGESTTGICVACVESKCQKELKTCEADCKCQGIADKALLCFTQSGGDLAKLFACATKAGIPIPPPNSAVGLGTCAQNSCPVECPLPDGGLDAGGD